MLLTGSDVIIGLYLGFQEVVLALTSGLKCTSGDYKVPKSASDEDWQQSIETRQALWNNVQTSINLSIPYITYF